MGQGNMVALKRTLDSFKGLYNEVIFGDVLLFPEDRTTLHSYQQEYNLKIVPLPFNYIFNYGFAMTLNTLAAKASNNTVLYMNIGEVLQTDVGSPVLDTPERVYNLINQMFPNFNSYAIDHPVETHKWVRLYDRTQLQWKGIIHEEVYGDKNCAEYTVFMFNDTPKDNDDPFKAKVFDDCKEIVYFQQYIKLVENPIASEYTNEFWTNYAKGSYDSLKERLAAKGKRYEAFQKGDLQMYMDDINSNPDFQELKKFDNTNLIHYQTHEL